MLQNVVDARVLFPGLVALEGTRRWAAPESSRRAQLPVEAPIVGGVVNPRTVRPQVAETLFESDCVRDGQLDELWTRKKESVSCCEPRPGHDCRQVNRACTRRITKLNRCNTERVRAGDKDFNKADDPDLESPQG